MWLIPLLMILGFARPEATPQAGAPIDEPARQAQTSLELTTTIIRQRYCSEAEGDHTLRLDLRLRYKNIGQRDIILYRGSSLAFRQMISSTVQDAASLRYLLDLSLAVAVTGLPEIATRRDLDRNFVVLAPNATFETIAGTGNRIFVKKSDAEKDSVGTFGTGEYVLQIQVPTFPYPETVANELRQRWKTTGELWTSGVVSRPMTFKVEKDREFGACGRLGLPRFRG